RKHDRALLRDVPIARQGHDEDVTERARLLEMRQVAEVDEVECAVALNDPLVAEAPADLRQLVHRDDLVALADAGHGVDHVACLWRSSSPALTASSANIWTVSRENSSRSFAHNESLLRRSVVTVMM